jgi:hypothetical protein
MRCWKLVPLLVLQVLGATPSWAAVACGDDGKNLLAKHNCSFASDVDGWEGVETRVEHDSADGGALAAIGTEGFVVVVGPCVKVKAGTDYRVSARVRAVGGEVHACSVTGRQFTDGRCEGGREQFETGVTVAPVPSDWQAVSGKATAAADAEAVRLHLECNAEDVVDVRFDDLVLARP